MLKKSIIYNILYLYTCFMGGCWLKCSKELSDKNNLSNNRSGLNDSESTDNSKAATTNASNSSLNNSNSVDTTFVEKTTQNHTTFPMQPRTNPNYNPNSEAEGANTLTKNSTDQQDGNSIPITDSLKIIIANNSKDENTRTNEHPGQKEESKSNTITTTNVNTPTNDTNEKSTNTPSTSSTSLPRDLDVPPSYQEATDEKDNEKEEQINGLGNEKTNNENEEIVPSAHPMAIYPNLSDLKMKP